MNTEAMSAVRSNPLETLSPMPDRESRARVILVRREFTSYTVNAK